MFIIVASHLTKVVIIRTFS